MTAPLVDTLPRPVSHCFQDRRRSPKLSSSRRANHLYTCSPFSTLPVWQIALTGQSHSATSSSQDCHEFLLVCPVADSLDLQTRLLLLPIFPYHQCRVETKISKTCIISH